MSISEALCSLALSLIHVVVDHYWFPHPDIGDDAIRASRATISTHSPLAPIHDVPLVRECREIPDVNTIVPGW
jgi:hypothetical protein